MKIFLDTSSLFKLYHKEENTILIENIFTENKLTSVYLSEITKVEFASAVWKKVRTKEISESAALTTLELFETDINKYSFITADSIIIEQARKLLTKYGNKGLRTLDSIQLSSAMILGDEVELFVTSDTLLKSFFEEERLPV